MEKLGLYVHIPFCVKKCNYCDFNSYGGAFEKEQPYFNALFSEIRKKGEKFKDFSCDTVYIGGGTPTSVKTENIVRLTEVLRENFSIEKDAEITIECNPKTAEKSDFEKYLKAGINRLSIGLQSTHDRLLCALGRIHTLKDFENCLSDARAAGFTNISADLMFALPGQSLSDWRETLLKTAEYGLSHISCYGLKIEKGTPFYNMELALPDEDTEAKMYETAAEVLKEKGYTHYEISNFAKPGFKSRHNLKYWSLMPYLGLGAGAYSSVFCERFSNVRSLSAYIKGSEKKEDCLTLSKNDLMSEFMFMGLRKTEGVSEADFFRLFDCDIFSVFGAPLKKYISQGVLLKKNNRIYINEKMLYISNLILCDFV